MQRTEPTSESRPERQFLTPLRAFAVGMILIGLFLGLWLVGQSGNPEEPPNTPVTAEAETDVPTDAEAIRIFEELSAVHHRAYRHRDATLIEQVYVPGSSANRQAHKQIEKLIEDNVVDKSIYRTKEVRILRRSPTEVALREKTLVRPRFVNEEGEDVTSEVSELTLQTTRWTLQLLQGEWLVSDVLIERLQPVK